MNSSLSVSAVFLSLAIIISSSSCKTSRKTTSTVPVATVEYKSPKTLSQELKKNEFQFEYISARFSSEMNIDSNKTSFSVSLRAKKDSVLWMSISPALGIEVARAVITKDSVKFIDRFHSQYFAGDFNYISKLLNADLDFDMIQAVLLGNSVEFYDEDDKLSSFIENNKYALSTTRRKKSKRVITRNKELKDPIQIIWLEPETYKITRVLFKDFNTDRTFDASFSKFDKVDSLLFPYRANYLINAEKKIELMIEYSKMAVNVPQTFPFSIPEKYNPIIYKEKEPGK